MKLFKSKIKGVYLQLKDDGGNVKTFYNLDNKLNMIPRLHEAGHQKTDINGDLSWETSVIRKENVEELIEIPEHLMKDLGDYELDMNDLAEEDCGTYRFVNEIIIETENYELVADVFYNRDVKKISGTRLQPSEEETLSVQTNIDLKAIHIGDMEFLPFSKEQKEIIEKRLEDNIYYD
jgi:hypothetical protein